MKVKELKALLAGYSDEALVVRDAPDHSYYRVDGAREESAVAAERHLFQDPGYRLARGERRVAVVVLE